VKVFITRNIPPIGIDLLKPHFEVELHASSETLPGEALKRKLKDADAVLCLLTDAITPAVMDAAPKLKVISNHAVGVDNVDVAYATRRGIAVTNTPGVLTDATADFTWTLLLALARNVAAGDAVVRNGRFHGWDPLFLLGADLAGKTLGIVGAGRIGTAVAERSAGWKMKILYFDRAPNPHLENTFHARRVSFPVLLKEADFVTIHLPLSAETTHLLGEPEFALMKPTAYLVNTARGAIIDEAALVRALREGKIAGAALDVYEREPALAEGLAERNNVLLAPHIASATVATRNKMAEIAARNIIHVLHGETPVSIVNPEVLNRVK